MGEFVEHAHLGEGERALEQAVSQHPDLPGVETVKGAHGGNGGIHNVTVSSISDHVNVHLEFTASGGLA